MTYREACEIDPRIRTIERRIRADKRSRFVVDHESAWAYGYKPLLLKCVGWDAEHEALRSSLVYETVYDRLRAVFEGRT